MRGTITLLYIFRLWAVLVQSAKPIQKSPTPSNPRRIEYSHEISNKLRARMVLHNQNNCEYFPFVGCENIFAHTLPCPQRSLLEEELHEDSTLDFLCGKKGK